jgi:hypothetical protein
MRVEKLSAPGQVRGRRVFQRLWRLLRPGPGRRGEKAKGGDEKLQAFQGLLLRLKG